MLHSFGVNVIAVLAGLGVGGIAVALAAQHPEWQDKEPFASLLKGDVKGALAGGERAMLDIIMATHAGMTTEEFEKIVQEWVATARRRSGNGATPRTP